MNAALVTGVAAVVAAVVSGLFMWLIKRSADKAASSAAVRQIEAGAYQRARDAYNDALTIKEREVRELTDKLARLDGQVAKLEGEVETERGERRAAVRQAQQEITGLRLQLRDAEATIAQLRRVIASQRRGDLPPGIDLGRPPPDLPDPPPPREE